MKIGDRIFVRGYIDEIRKDAVIVRNDGGYFGTTWNEVTPSAQPDRDVIDDCLRHIHKNISVHTATGGVIAIRYYMEKLYEEIYGKGERPWWMT